MSAPNDEHIAGLQEVIREVRRAFHQLKAAAREAHGGDSLAGGRRGVLLNLLQGGPQTVPTMAAARPVSRQHIQTLVNQLRGDGLVRLEENPKHKRSKLVALTAEGRDRIQAMLARERRIFRSLALETPPQDLRTTARVLREVRELFRGDAWREALEDAPS